VRRLEQGRKGVLDVYLDVYVDNAPEIRAYEKFGFEGSRVRCWK